ncbi:MAG: hypothetical protein Q4G40_12710, partial [Brachybacterium sp.]|nr:hypothetical protein [Brachybacterium sp.]
MRDPIERARLYAANAWAMAGRSMSEFRSRFDQNAAPAGAAPAGPGYARGGIVRFLRDAGGDLWDTIKDGARFVADAIADPKGIFDRIYDAVIKGVPAAGVLTDAVKAVGKRTLNGVIETLLPPSPSEDPKAAANVRVGPMPAGASRSLSYASQVARAHGLTMTSGYRPGARTSSGSLSMHGMNRARDYSNSTGPTPQMMAFFNALHPLRPTELLYSPAGPRQWRRWGGMSDTSGAVRRLHWNHVHVAFAKGGVLGDVPMGAPGGYTPKQDLLAQPPVLYDRGGYLQPGLSLVENRTGRPEPVFTGQQGDSILQLLERGGPAGTNITVPIEATQLSEADVDRLADEIMRRLALHMQGV